MIAIKEKQNKAFEHLKGKFGYTNVMQSPKLVKIIVSSGIGSLKDKKKKELIENRLSRITGQKAAEKGAKKSIASFKVRQGDPVAFQTTIRGERMMNFVEKLINIALPRTKDFRGIKESAVDVSALNLGIKEHTIFPETADEDVKDVFGLAITIVTTAKNKEENRAFFEALGFPFVKPGNK